MIDKNLANIGFGPSWVANLFGGCQGAAAQPGLRTPFIGGDPTPWCDECIIVGESNESGSRSVLSGWWVGWMGKVLASGGSCWRP